MKKVINGILLVVVAGVWIYIVIRLIKGNEIPKVENKVQATYFTPSEIAKDTFRIVDSYEDPFRVGVKTKKTKIRNIIKKQDANHSHKNVRRSYSNKNLPPGMSTKRQLLNKVTNDLKSRCSYKGFVHNLNESKPLGLFVFNGRILRKKTDESFNENYQIKAIFRDSAWINIKEYETVITLRKG